MNRARPLLHSQAAMLLSLGVTLLVIGCGGHTADRTAGIELQPISAPLDQAERREVARQIELAGTVEAGRVASVSSRVMAMVTAVHVRAGNAVETGELLLEIDPQAARGQLAQAEGALAQARAALALAERNDHRFRALAAREAASPLEVDLARMEYAQALGAVQQAEGSVASASAVAEDSRVVAPFAGRIKRRLVEVGDLAAPGRPLLVLESQATRRLRLPVPESIAAEVRLGLGDELRVRIDSRPGLGSIRGTVVEISPSDPLTHSLEVKIDLPQHGLSTGSAGRAWIVTGRREVVTVPESAIVRQGGLDLVVTVDRGKAASRAVSLGGALGDGHREVLAGLDGGETVALGFATAPPDGTPIVEDNR